MFRLKWSLSFILKLLGKTKLVQKELESCSPLHRKDRKLHSMLKFSVMHTEPTPAVTTLFSVQSSSEDLGPTCKKSKSPASVDKPVTATSSRPKLVPAVSDVSRSSKLVGGKDKKLKSIQDDPKASSAYKSLFNSHETAKRQPKAHWVTYNPCYN